MKLVHKVPVHCKKRKSTKSQKRKQ